MAADITAELGDVEYYDRNGNLVGRAFIEGLDGYVPYREVADGKTPVLVVHRDQDPTVPVDHAHKFTAALKQAGNPYRLPMVAGADHTFNSHAWEPEVLDVTARWVA